MSWWTGSRVTVTGGRGFLGRHLVERLSALGPDQVFTFSSRDYDLTRQSDVARMYADQRPDVVIHLAARVGGIGANRDQPGRFFYENAIMGIELMEQARRNGVQKFVQVGTVCAYPKFTPVPFSEEEIWNGYPEETNAAYGIAKKALLAQARAYREQYGFNAIYLLPANLYGPYDNFDLETSHVIPALIRKCLEACEAGLDEIEVWGSGTPTREFLYVDDAARGILLAAEHYDSPDAVNLGTSVEVSIQDLVQTIARLVGFQGRIGWNRDRPDGQPRRKLDVSRARREFGFSAEVDLEVGLRRTIDWCDANLRPVQRSASV
jgi:GDP-L-fucose synthase